MNTASSVEPFNELTMTRFGRMLVNRNDVYIGQSLIRYGEYSWGEVLLMEQLVSPDSTIVEAGANIGSHTIPLAQRLSGGRLYAFEPQRMVFQTLCANLALNQCTNVHSFWSGLGSREGSITIPDIPPNIRSNFGGVSANSYFDQVASLSVPCATIDGLGLDDCTLIKADVEGMELEVIKGASKTIDKYRPVLYLEADRKDQRAALIRALFDLDYDLWWHIPPLFSPDNMFGDTEDIFNIISSNLVGLPAENKTPVTGLAQVTNENDWPWS